MSDIWETIYSDVILPVLVMLVCLWAPSYITILLVNRHLRNLDKELDRWIWLKKMEIKNGKVGEKKVIIEYQPPQWLNPTEVWFLYDWSVWKPDVICMIYKRANMWLVSLNYVWWKIIVKKLLNIKSWAPEYEQVFWDIVFRRWNSVEFPNDRIYWELWAVKHSLLKFCQWSGRIWKSSVYFSLDDIFSDARKIWYIPFWRLIWLVIWWLMVISWFVIPLCTRSMPLLGLSLIIPVIWLFVVVCFWVPLSETQNKSVIKYTEEWKEVVAKIYWYKQFLESCEEKQLKKFMKEDPMYLDKTLPYAVALGLENIISSKIPENVVLDDERTSDIFLLEKVL